MTGSGGTEPLIPAEPGGSMWVRVQPGLLREIQNSQGYTEKSYLKKVSKNKKKTDKIEFSPAALCPASPLQQHLVTVYAP